MSTFKKTLFFATFSSLFATTFASTTVSVERAVAAPPTSILFDTEDLLLEEEEDELEVEDEAVSSSKPGLFSEVISDAKKGLFKKVLCGIFAICLTLCQAHPIIAGCVAVVTAVVALYALYQNWATIKAFWFSKGLVESAKRGVGYTIPMLAAILAAYGFDVFDGGNWKTKKGLCIIGLIVAIVLFIERKLYKYFQKQDRNALEGTLAIVQEDIEEALGLQKPWYKKIF